MNEEEAAFRESLLNTLAGTFSVNHQERSCAEDQLKIFETSEGESTLQNFSFLGPNASQHQMTEEGGGECVSQKSL